MLLPGSILWTMHKQGKEKYLSHRLQGAHVAEMQGLDGNFNYDKNNRDKNNLGKTMAYLIIMNIYAQFYFEFAQG